MNFSRPIGYLEYNDFSSDGKLLLAKNPVFVMIQGSYCGACSKAKPAFQELANQQKILCMTIQLDGERQSERDIGKILDKIYPNMVGVPSYILYKNETNKIPYTGGRSREEMMEFIKANSI
jgi:thiol-disulfide isomerase/thioredoxin